MEVLFVILIASFRHGYVSSMHCSKMMMIQIAFWSKVQQRNRWDSFKNKNDATSRLEHQFEVSERFSWRNFSVHDFKESSERMYMFIHMVLNQKHFYRREEVFERKQPIKADKDKVFSQN